MKFIRVVDEFDFANNRWDVVLLSMSSVKYIFPHKDDKYDNNDIVISFDNRKYICADRFCEDDNGRSIGSDWKDCVIEI